MTRQWTLLLIAAQWGSAPGQEMQLIGGAPSAAPSASPSYPTSECPRARFDMQANRYMVEPVSERVRAVLELRYKIRGHSPCTGPLVAEPDDTFSFEAAHFIPERDLWQGVLTQAPERLINAASGRSKRGIMENNIRESAEDFDGTENNEEQFEVCVVKKGLCIATLERPPLRSVFDRLGMFTLRERTPQINAYLSWMCALFVIFLVVVLVQVMFVHFLLSCLFRDRADRHDEQETPDDEPTPFEEKVVPTSYEVIMQVCISLGRMAVAASTLIVVVCVFVFRREVDPWDGRIMTFYPLLIMFLHVLVVLLSTFKTLLYNSLLRDQVHIVFKSNSMTSMITSPLWILVFGFTIIFLYTGLNTLIEDARTGSCIVSETGDNGGECSTLQMCLNVGISLWGLLLPVGMCIYYIFLDYFFENQFMPLYKIFNLDDKMEAAPYLGALTSVTYSDFTTAAHQLYVEAKKKNKEDGRDEGWSSGVYDVTAKGIIAKLADMKKDDRAGDEADELADTWFGREAKTPRWFAESLSMWSWRLRMRHSKKKALELRLLLVVVTAAFSWTLFAAFGASVYRQLCIPSLEEVTTSIGQLSPEFDRNIFNYNIFVDTHIKSAGLEVIAEKKFTATTAFHMPSLSDDPQTEPWIKKAKNVHVPFLVRNALMNRNASQAEELRASRRAPVPIELHVRGAGTTLVYRITVVKLETRVASLTYKYNTSSSVDEVVVHKNVNWEKVMPAEEVGAEKEEFAEDTEGAAVYVPDDTKEVLIDMQRELAIFGPTGGFVISGFELAKFEAVRKLQLCPPSGRGAACEEQDSPAIGTSRSKVNLDKSVTALPVELQPDGTDPLRFFVSIIRISNRLINLEMEGAMGARATGGGEWASMGFLPAFRPLVDKYETFFEVPEARLHEGQSEEEEEWHTLFLRVKPQGNARSNRLEAELTPNREGDEDLSLFCRPAADDGADEPLDPTVEAATKDLSCGASEEEVVKAEAGKPTEELIISAGDLAFRNHFYVRYKYRLSDPKPFTLTLRVMFNDHVLKGVNETGTDMILSHRTYEVKFLPQAPMRLDFFAPLPQLEPPQTLQEPVADATALVVQTHSKRGLRLRKQEPPKPAQNFGLPIFLTPPFSSEVLVYDAMVPAGSEGDILIRMTGSHSLWVGSGDQPLEGVGRGSALRQTIKVQHGPNCGDDEESVFAGAPMPAPVGSSALCPVSLRIFERRDGFPRSYGIRLQEAPADTVLLVGLLHHDQGGQITAMPMPGFQPGLTKINSTFCDMHWDWELPSVPAPAPASPTEQASPASAAEPAADAAAKGAADEASEEASEKAKQPQEAEAAPSGATDQEAAASSLVPNEKAVPTPAPKLGRQAAKEQAANDLNDVIQPPAIEKTIPREAKPEPTSEPRKMDQEALLPFFLQTDSEPAPQVHEPDGIFEASTEDDNEAPLFGPLVLLPAAKKESSAVAVTPSPAQRAPQQEEAPLFSSFFRGGAAPAPAAALPTLKATTTTAAPPQDPTAWETGEPLPRATLAVLAGSPSAQVSARWNNLEVSLDKKEGAWSYVQISGKMLVEGCWCDRKHLANRCKDILRKQAPLALKLYYRSNQCLLSISSNGKLMHQIEVGLAGASSPALQERALEEAADSAGAAVKLLRLSRGMPPQAAPVLPHSSESELLIAP